MTLLSINSPSPSSSFNNYQHHHEFNTNDNIIKDHSLIFQNSQLHNWYLNNSVLCMVTSSKRKLLFCGTQNSNIIVIDLQTFQIKLKIQTHVGSVLCLYLSDCENTLFSAGSDSLVKIWKINDFIEKIDNSSNTDTLQLLPTYTIYSLLDIGDIFSITWIADLKTIFIGSQNASLSFVKLDLINNNNSSINDHYKLMPSNRFDRFFDSNNDKLPIHADTDTHTRVIQIPNDNIISYAHNGYVYAIDFMKIDDPLTFNIGNNISDNYENIIFSAGGDGKINIWGYNNNLNDLILLNSLSNDQIDTIFSITIHKPSMTIYSGSSNGNIAIWDLTTFQLLKIFQINDKNDIYTLTISPKINNYSNEWLFIGTEFGITKKLISNIINKDINDLIIVTKNAPCLTLNSFQMNNKTYLISGGSDNSLSLWSLKSMNDICDDDDDSSEEIDNEEKFFKGLEKTQLHDYITNNENFLKILKELISFRSVSKQPDIYMNECRKCANYLMLLLKNFGAYKTELLPVDNGNPIVYSTFKANKLKKDDGTKPTNILWYGHYDVIPASSKNWNTNPFKMTPKDGYLYARGVTDNKGPLLVSIFAIAELYSRGELESNITFLIEGEEESGSWGFQNVIINNKIDILKDFNNIDWILLSNSYWLDDNIPSLNYGLRGKIEFEIKVWSDKPDRHSGVDGGVFIEPSMELVKLLSLLVKDDKILIPGFEEIYDKNRNINEINDWEKLIFEEISERIENCNINELKRKWNLPSLTLHKINMSGTENNTLISQFAEAKLSIRIIPGQEIENVKNDIINFINKEFNKFQSKNYIEIKIIDEAEPWLGDINNIGFQTLKECLNDEWGIKPIFIKEGGSIPSIRFLEKLFKCCAIHVPTGQSSDNAHLNNERIRIVNLLKSKEIIKKAVNRLPKNEIVE